MCWSAAFTHELFTYQKSNEWAQRTSKISGTKTTSAHLRGPAPKKRPMIFG